MAKVLFKRKTTAEIEDLEVEDGALIYNTDNGKTYMDFEEERIQTGGNADTIIARQTTAPTDEDIKLWINPNKVTPTGASNVVDSMEGTQTDKSPSVNAVKNYIKNEIIDAEVYSTDEVKTNKVWIDDKPIYRKVLDIGNADFYPSTDKHFTHDIDNLGVMVNIDYSMYFPGDSSYYKQWDKIITVKANSTRVSFTTGAISGTYIRFTNVKIVLEYTKTTD